MIEAYHEQEAQGISGAKQAQSVVFNLHSILLKEDPSVKIPPVLTALAETYALF